MKNFLASILALFLSATAWAGATLLWTGSSGADTYRVYRDGLAVANVTGLTYTDPSGVSGSCYNITAVNAFGESDPSNGLCAMWPPAPKLESVKRGNK